ncbi:MAG: hypothetical protein COB00_11755 [Alcanivorax sp.]|nr:MAG: hypothetical protein COB00_11755 [Alcanivorax sp.]
MGFPQLQKRSFILRLAHKIIYFGVRQRSILNEPIHLFTSFNLESLPNQQVTRHGYEYLKASYANKAQGEVNEIWFFGSKYSEAGILSESDELALFNEVITKLSDLNFTVKYIPHRDESEQKLERFRVKTNVEILRLEVPAEIQLIQGEVRPKAIAGYYTTVLLSCAALQPTIEIYSFKIPSNLINGNYLPSIQNVYSFFKQAKLKVIDLSYQRDEHPI